MDNLDFALIGKRIKEVRTDRHLTQEYLANASDVNVSHISNIETNKVKVSLTLLVSICNAMNVTVDYILGNEYKAPTTAYETELLNTVNKLDDSKKNNYCGLLRFSDCMSSHRYILPCISFNCISYSSSWQLIFSD